MLVFTDPQTVTISSVAQSLPRVSTEDHASTYVKDDETVQLNIGHQSTKAGRVRRQVKLDVNKMATDPFIPANSRRVSASFTFVLDEPEDASFTNAELLANAKGLIAWLSDANVTKVIAGEN